MAANNNNNLTTSIPVFTGSDFRIWEQKMGDYFKSQCLWRITTNAPGSTWPVEVITGAPTWLKRSSRLLGMRTPSKCRTSLALAFLRCSAHTSVRHVPRPGLTLEPGLVPLAFLR